MTKNKIKSDTFIKERTPREEKRLGNMILEYITD